MKRLTKFWKFGFPSFVGLPNRIGCFLGWDRANPWNDGTCELELSSRNPRSIPRICIGGKINGRRKKISIYCRPLLSSQKSRQCSWMKKTRETRTMPQWQLRVRHTGIPPWTAMRRFIAIKSQKRSLVSSITLRWNFWITKWNKG